MKIRDFKSQMMAVVFAGIAVIFLLTAAPPHAAAQEDGLLGRRGAMVGAASADDLSALRAQGANLVRWQINPDNPNLPDAPVPARQTDFDAYMKQYQQNLDQIISDVKSLKPVLEENGLVLVMDLHTPPFRRIPSKGTAVFYDARVLNAYYSVWDKLTREFKDNSTIVAFDLINEPYLKDRKTARIDWNTLAAKTASRIRNAGAHQIVVVESELGDPAHFDRLRPLPASASPVVYSFHFYKPAPFLFQKMADGQTGRIRYPNVQIYPGMISGVRWDRKQLLRALKPVREFQRELRAHGRDDGIFVGEFAVGPFAPPESAGKWLDDCIDIFEQWHFSWTFHAWREANVWNIELQNDPDTGVLYNYPARLNALQRGWLLNNH